MDHMFFMDGNLEDDIECCRVVNAEASPVPDSNSKLENPLPAKVSTGPNLPVKGGKGDNLGGVNVEVMIEIDNNVAGVVAAYPVEKKMEKDKRTSMSGKKPPKPPRPPRGFSLDAADQKLIKELAELAMIKRAKIERIKALKKMKAAKASSSSGGSLFALLCTVIFSIVIICQGISSRNNAAVSFHNPLLSAGPSNSSFTVVQDPTSLSATAENSTHSEPPNLMETASNLDTENFGNSAIG